MFRLRSLFSVAFVKMNKTIRNWINRLFNMTPSLSTGLDHVHSEVPEKNDHTLPSVPRPVSNFEKNSSRLCLPCSKTTVFWVNLGQCKHFNTLSSTVFNEESNGTIRFAIRSVIT